MTPDELLETMRAVLTDEREGILRFDGEVISRASEAKSAVLRRVRAAPLAERPALCAALDELQPALRCNLILLTHARAYLRDMQEELQAKSESAVIPVITRRSA